MTLVLNDKKCQVVRVKNTLFVLCLVLLLTSILASCNVTVPDAQVNINETPDPNNNDPGDGGGGGDPGDGGGGDDPGDGGGGGDPGDGGGGGDPGDGGGGDDPGDGGGGGDPGDGGGGGDPGQDTNRNNVEYFGIPDHGGVVRYQITENESEKYTYHLLTTDMNDPIISPRSINLDELQNLFTLPHSYQSRETLMSQGQEVTLHQFIDKDSDVYAVIATNEGSSLSDIQVGGLDVPRIPFGDYTYNGTSILYTRNATDIENSRYDIATGQFTMTISFDNARGRIESSTSTRTPPSNVNRDIKPPLFLSSNLVGNMAIDIRNGTFVGQNLEFSVKNGNWEWQYVPARHTGEPIGLHGEVPHYYHVGGHGDGSTDNCQSPTGSGCYRWVSTNEEYLLNDSATLYGAFHGENATGVTGIYHGNNVPRIYGGAIIGSRTDNRNVVLGSGG